MASPLLMFEPFSERDNLDYGLVITTLQQKFHEGLTDAGRVVFRVNPGIPLTTAFFGAIPKEYHSQVQCKACLKFLEADGTLVTVTEDNDIKSLVWDEQALGKDNIYFDVVRALREAVEHPDSVITGPKAWSPPSKTPAPAKAAAEEEPAPATPCPETCEHEEKCAKPAYTHWIFTPLPSHCVTRLGESGGSVMSKIKRAYAQFVQSFQSLPPWVVAKAAQFIEQPGVPGGIAMRPGARFFAAAQQAAIEAGFSAVWPSEDDETEGDKAVSADEASPAADVVVPESAARRIWAAAARASPGWSAPKSHAFGTVCEMVQAKKSDEDICRALQTVFNPYVYQRPQAPANDQSLEAGMAELARLGCESALRRRFASISDVKLLWTPDGSRSVLNGKDFDDFWDGITSARKGDLGTGESTDEGASGFSSSSACGKSEAISMHKLRTEVLPTASRLWLKTPTSGSYGCITTAADPDSMPILQWDSQEARNTCDFYVYTGGSTASHWGLTEQEWTACTGLTLRPAHWADENKFAHYIPAVLFMLDKAMDSKNESSALFPSSLKNELHGLRRVVETTSLKSKREPATGPHAAGLFVFGSETRSTTTEVRVETRDGALVSYRVFFEKYSDPADVDF